MEEKEKKMKTAAYGGTEGAREILHPFRGAINRSVRQPGAYLPAFFFCRPIRNPVSTSSKASPVLIRR